MAAFVIVAGILLILVVLWEGFETIILPRRVTRRFRLTRVFYRCTWIPWKKLVALLPVPGQETWLSVYGPLSLLLLLSLWALGLVTGFALLHFGLETRIHSQADGGGFFTYLYLSSTTFFTLGLGDVIPAAPLPRCLVVVESGMGFGFLALIIAYLPALNQFFSHREVSISLLDARAGSPPTALQMLLRHAYPHGQEALRELLFEWERWAAEFMEGHLSYPVLAYFRSQHDNQSWLGALAAILDTSALVMVGIEGACARQAELTFAMARHALVDLSLVFRTRPVPGPDRLPPERLVELRAELAAAGVKLQEEGAEQKLAELRGLYEPYLRALSLYFRYLIPPWLAGEQRVDNWQASSWEERATSLAVARRRDREHF